MVVGSILQLRTQDSTEDMSYCVSSQQMYTITNISFYVSSLKRFMLHVNWLCQLVIGLSLNSI